MAFDSISQQDVVHTGNSEKSYQAILLKHVLSYAPDKGYKIKSFGQFIPKIRAFNLMATDGGIDVMIGTATKERAALYQPKMMMHKLMCSQGRDHAIAMHHSSTQMVKYVPNDAYINIHLPQPSYPTSDDCTRE